MTEILIHNVELNEVIKREMTSDEFHQFEIDKEALQIEETKKAEIIASKAALLQKLGITEEEAKLLLS